MTNNENQQILTTPKTTFRYQIHEPETNSQDAEGDLVRGLAHLGIFNGISQLFDKK